MDLTAIIIAIATAIGGIAAGAIFANLRVDHSLEAYQKKAQDKLDKAEKKVNEISENAEQKVKQTRENIVEEEKQRLDQFKRHENLIKSKEEQIQRRKEQVTNMKKDVETINGDIEDLRKKNEQTKHDITEKLTQKTSLTTKTARETVINDLKKDLELMKEERIRKHEECLEEDKVRIAKDMLAGVIQRYSSPTSVEKKSLAVVVKHDDQKGKVLGENGKNLQLLQELTECDIIFNDAPNTILISCLDLVKKHIARETILKLLNERHVDEAKIRQKIEEVKVEMEKLLIKVGKQTVEKLELNKRQYNDDFYRILGRLKFRSSYGQNILKHSFEVGYFTLMLGAELGVDMETCRIAGFFHDLGKAIDHEVQEPHDHLTKKIMEEHGFPDNEVHAAWAHHDAVPQETPEAMLVKAADAISAGRPGARQETLEKFLEHIKMIEGVANSYEGVKKTFAISAGRELRVLVEPQILEDQHLGELASRISEEIQDQKAYPGKVKVNVIRRTTNADTARKQRTQKALKS